MQHDQSSSDPYNLTIGSGGLHLYGSTEVYIKGSGKLTSSESFLDIELHTEGGINDHLFIKSVIADNGSKQVGLSVSGTHKNWAAVVLDGNRSNTFTGDTVVRGAGNVLSLAKTEGAKAIRGNILIDSAKIALWQSDQISKTSTVTVKNGALQFVEGAGVKKEFFKKFSIEGHSKLQFGSSTSVGQRFLYLDDLVVSNGSLLEVQGWQEGRDWLLVRKTSSHLNDALKKIRFQGYDPNAIHLEEYNKEYWAISGAPEPSTYGAIFGAGGLGLALYRRRRAAASA